MEECINGVLYMVGRYFGLLGSMAFAGTTVLCYFLGAFIVSNVVGKLFSLISRQERAIDRMGQVSYKKGYKK